MREANEGWAAYVGALVRARYAGNSSALAKALDVSTSTVTRWIDGATPRIAQLKQLSQVEQIPMVDLLIAAGAIETGTDVGHAGALPPQANVDVAAAILRDGDLIDEAKTHLLNQYDLLRRLSPTQVSSGAGNKAAAVTPLRRPRRAAARPGKPDQQ